MVGNLVKKHFIDTRMVTTTYMPSHGGRYLDMSYYKVTPFWLGTRTNPPRGWCKIILIQWMRTGGILQSMKFGPMVKDL